MEHKEKIEKAKKYLSDEGYGTGSNLTIGLVASLMVEYSEKELKNFPKSDVSGRFYTYEEIKEIRKEAWDSGFGNGID